MSETDLSQELAQSLRLTIGKLKRRMREQTEIGGISWSQVSVISLLDREGAATVSALAKGESMRPQSMGAIVAELEAAKLVEGHPDPKDGRQTLFQLTEEGQKVLIVGRASRMDWLTKSIQSNLTPQEQQTLSTAVELLNRLLSE